MHRSLLGWDLTRNFPHPPAVTNITCKVLVNRGAQGHPSQDKPTVLTRCMCYPRCGQEALTKARSGKSRAQLDGYLTGQKNSNTNGPKAGPFCLSFGSTRENHASKRGRGIKATDPHSSLSDSSLDIRCSSSAFPNEALYDRLGLSPESFISGHFLGLFVSLPSPPSYPRSAVPFLSPCTTPCSGTLRSTGQCLSYMS